MNNICYFGLLTVLVLSLFFSGCDNHHSSNQTPLGQDQDPPVLLMGTPPPILPQNNILFAHDVCSTPADWNILANFAKNVAGYEVYRTSVPADPAGSAENPYTGCGSLEDRAYDLAVYISGLEIPDGSLIAVGHGVGGIDLRIIGVKADSGTEPYLSAARKFKKVYTLAAPHGGSLMALSGLGLAYGDIMYQNIFMMMGTAVSFVIDMWKYAFTQDEIEFQSYFSNPETTVECFQGCFETLEDVSVLNMDELNSRFIYDRFRVDGFEIPFLAYYFQCPTCAGATDCAILTRAQAWEGAPAAQEALGGSHLPVWNCDWELGNINLIRSILIDKDLSTGNAIATDFKDIASAGDTVWAVAEGGYVWRFDNASLNWTLMSSDMDSNMVSFVEISAAGMQEETVVAVAEGDVIWSFDTDALRWQELPNNSREYVSTFTRVSVGGTAETSIWAIAEGGKIWKYNQPSGTWTKLSDIYDGENTFEGTFNDISAGHSTEDKVYAVGLPNGRMWKFNIIQSYWEVVESATDTLVEFNRVSVSDNGQAVFALAAYSDKLYQRNDSDTDWEILPDGIYSDVTGFMAISAGSSGSRASAVAVGGAAWVYDFTAEVDYLDWVMLPEGMRFE